eukprot:scaffold83604_cov34-Tisochrysis_lutea.AAC.4
MLQLHRAGGGGHMMRQGLAGSGKRGCLRALGHPQPFTGAKIAKVTAMDPLRDEHAWPEEVERPFKERGILCLVAIVHLLEDSVGDDVDDLDEVSVAPSRALDHPQHRRQHGKVERHLPHSRGPLHLHSDIGTRACYGPVDLPQGSARDRRGADASKERGTVWMWTAGRNHAWRDRPAPLELLGDQREGISIRKWLVGRLQRLELIADLLVENVGALRERLTQLDRHRT